MSKTLVRVLAFTALFIAVVALLFFWSSPAGQSKSNNASNLSATSATPSSPGHPTETAASPWPQWGGALNSASLDGRGFFNRRKAREFSGSINVIDKKYVIELNARALLPQKGNAVLDEIFSAQRNSATAYLQFIEHPTIAQRQRIEDAGLELLSYVSGYAWTARGSRDAFQTALDQGFVRAVATFDPRDKMHPLVFAKQIPSYAQTEDGSARLMLIAAPGTAQSDLEASLSAVPQLAQVSVSPKRASVLGPRFELEASIDVAPQIAALDQTAFLGLIPPPVTQRDATTDLESNIDDVRDGPPNLNGSGVKVALRELGRMDAHADFASRLTYVENDGDSSSGNVAHATAVTGVVGSDGTTQPSAKGVAPAVSMLAYSVGGNDAFAPGDIADAVTRGARISNHSYGPDQLTTWGDYQPESADWDATVRNNGLITVCAGNEETGGLFKHIDFFVGAKNTVCVGATNLSARAEDPDDSPAVAKADGLAFYAEFGPMNDGRVKPDLVAFGGDGGAGGVTLDLGTSGTQSNSGTSFSTPAVTGVSALIFQQYKAVFSTEPSAQLAKALLCNSASDLGSAGPDAKYGFGILNAEGAVATINLKQGSSNSPFLEDLVTNGASKTYQIDVQNITELRMTLCWLDVAGSPMAAKALVNDLDIDLQDPVGNHVFPFSLDANNPSNPATATAPNTVDPIEQVLVTNPANGTWTITVKGSSIPQGNQGFAICCNQSILPIQLSAVISASPDMGPAPLAVSFSAAQSVGTITDYLWDFGDGTTDQGSDHVQVSHTYSAPGAYTTTLTLNGGAAGATHVIIVTKPVISATALKGKVTLNFRSDPEFPDDMFQFTLQSSDLIRPKTDLPTFAGLTISIRAGGSPDGTTPTTKITSVTLDIHGRARTITTTVSLNLSKGTIIVQLRKTALEDLFALQGMTRSPGSSGSHDLPVEIETDKAVYRGVLHLIYVNRNGTSGTAKSF